MSDEFTIVKAEEIHSAMANYSVKFITMMHSMLEAKLSVDAEYMLKDFEYLGLKGSSSYKNLSKKIETFKSLSNRKDYILDLISFITKAKKEYGDHVLLMSFDDFYLLLDKYNLYSNKLEYYTGEIPHEYVSRLADLKRYKKDLLMNTSMLKIDSVQTAETFKRHGISEEKYFAILNTINRFPFVNCNNYFIQEREKGRLFRTKILGENVYFGSNTYVDPIAPNMIGDKSLYIACPEHEISKVSNPIGNYDEIKIRPEDPFIFSITPYGVCIWEKWGIESDDVIFDSYNELFDSLIERSAVLTDNNKSIIKIE